MMSAAHMYYRVKDAFTKLLVSPRSTIWICGLPALLMILDEKCLISDCKPLSNWRPMRRFALKMVFVGFRAAWFLAMSPIRRSVKENATHDGILRTPSTVQHS